MPGAFVNVLRALARLALNRLGYDVRRSASGGAFHFAEPGADPLTFEYLPRRRGYGVFEIAIGEVSGFHALALPLQPTLHPFVRAVHFAMLKPNEQARHQTIELVLRRYYSEVQPSCATEALGLSSEEAPGLSHFAPVSYMLPWTAKSPAEIDEERPRIALFEGLQNGVRASLADGVTAFGPVNAVKIDLEARRLGHLLESVQRAGFIRFDKRGPLEVAALRRNGKYVWSINSGHHRFAIAAAVGLERVPAVVTEVIRREDAPHWPRVVDGVFTEQGAIRLFDRIFDLEAAPVCEGWLDGIKKERTG